MDIVETIKKRRSVRTYTGERLNNELILQIRQYIGQLRPPFGVNARINLIQSCKGTERIKLGTYGWIKGAQDYMVLIYEEAPFAETAASYMFEQVILFCTDLGLGTCWLGGVFNRNDFKKQIHLKPNEKLKIVSPLGYPSNTKRWIEKIIIGADKKHRSRKYFGELFFNSDFRHSLTESKAGIYAQPLEMVRLAPSANNKQEWRVVLDNNALHFYKKTFLTFDTIDIGIALCHFEQTCKVLGIAGTFNVLKNYPKNDKMEYVISWIEDVKYIKTDK